MRIFLIPFSVTILKTKILGLISFSTKNSITWGVKYKKLRLKKIVGNLLDKLRKLYIKGHLENFSHPQAIEKSTKFLLLRRDILQIENSRLLPLLIGWVYDIMMKLLLCLHSTG